MRWQDDSVAIATEPRVPVPAWQRDEVVGAPRRGEMTAPTMAAAVNQHFRESARGAKTFDEFLEAGFQSSVTGLVNRGKAPDLVLDETAPWYGRLAAGVAGLGGDLPAMVAGGLLATAGTGGRGGPILAAGGAFALPVGLRAVLMDAYTKGEVTSASDFLDRLFHVVGETGKGWLTGVATGGAGVLARAGTAASPLVVRATVPTAAEITTMTTVASALEGRLPEPQDFMDAAILIGGLQLASRTAMRLRTVYKSTGIPPEQVLADAARDPVLKAELIGATDQKLTRLEKAMAEIDALAEKHKDEPLIRQYFKDRDLDRGIARIVDKYSNELSKETLDTLMPRMARDWETGESIMAADSVRGTHIFDLREEIAQRRMDIEGVPSAYQAAAQAETARAIVPGEKASQVAASPFALELPQAAGEPAKPTHVNYNYITSPQETKLALARLSEVYEREIQTQRRGTVSWEQTSAETAKLLSDTLGGVDQKLLMPREPGTAAGAAELLARKQMVVGAAESMMGARDNLLAKGTKASAEDRLQFIAAVERTAMIQAEFLGARAEAGRALNILKSTAMDAERAKAIQNVIDIYGKDPVRLAEMMKELDNPASALKFAREAVKATTWEKVVEAWKASILSGPVTHAANIIGNTTFSALRVPIDAVASMIGKVRGGQDAMSIAEPFARVYGNLQGVADGLRMAGTILKTGETPGKSEQFRKAIEGTKGEVIRLPFRALSAEDAVFTSMAERAEAHALAARQASREGLNPATREFRERVVQIVENPDPKMAQEIKAAGERFTFNAELGEKGRAVQEFVRRWHLQWAVPFIRTPGNVFKELFKMTPLAPLVKEWRDAVSQGGVARDKALAELAVGTGIMSTVFYQALEGNITGAGDPDPNKRRVQMAAGWQPYSVKVGDTYYNYQRLQPLGTLIGMAADVANVWDHLTEEESDKVPKMLSVAFANAVTNQTFLQGITNIVNALSDPQRFGPRMVQQYAGSVVPNIIAQPTAMLDPVVREVNSVVDAVKARIPGMRGELLAKRDIFGEPIESKARVAGVSPITEMKESTDKVRTEAARLGVAVADTPKKTHLGRGSGKMGDVELTPDERDRYAEIGGRLAHSVLEQIVYAPNWDALPDLVKKNIYRRVFTQAHKAAAAQALPIDKRLGLLMEITEKVQAELSPVPQ